MFSLIAGFLRYLFAQTEVKVLIVGLDHAGKTTLLEQMKGLFSKTDGVPLEKIPPTIGLNIGRMNIGRSRVIFWDLGGQVSLRSIWSRYYSDANGVVFVVDSADPGRFADAREALASVAEHGDLGTVPLLVLANKQDLPNAVPAQRVGAQVGVDDIASRPCRLQPISALTCEGVEEGVQWLVETVRSQGPGPS